MLTVDLLHEVELGTWRTLFTHLVRILYSASSGTNNLVAQLDERYEFFYFLSSQNNSFHNKIPHDTDIYYHPPLFIELL